MKNFDFTLQTQIQECLDLLKETFKEDLLGVYLYGSAVFGGLQKYSDIDIFVVLDRSTTRTEKSALVKALLNISGIYMKSKKRPIEMTIVEKSAINPWHYPPVFDFQYGEWLRSQFESGDIEPWRHHKEMPDLALLVTQILLASDVLMGSKPDQLLCTVPYKDFITATTDSLPQLVSELESDTRNVLLALARIWSTMTTNKITSKVDAANLVISYLPTEYKAVMERAKAICVGDTKEHWDDIKDLVKPCADFILDKINSAMSDIETLSDFNRVIYI